MCAQVTGSRSAPLVVHACTSTTNPQTLFGWWSLGYRCASSRSACKLVCGLCEQVLCWQSLAYTMAVTKELGLKCAHAAATPADTTVLQVLVRAPPVHAAGGGHVPPHGCPNAAGRGPRRLLDLLALERCGQRQVLGHLWSPQGAGPVRACSQDLGRLAGASLSPLQLGCVGTHVREPCQGVPKWGGNNSG